MIKYYYGDMGSGKTLSMIIDAELIRRKIESMNKNFLCFTDIDYNEVFNQNNLLTFATASNVISSFLI